MTKAAQRRYLAMTKISFTWATRREGNNGFVLETSSTGTRREFGPMPAHIVPAFVHARRRLVALRASEAGFDADLEADFEYLHDSALGKPPTLN